MEPSNGINLVSCVLFLLSISFCSAGLLGKNVTRAPVDDFISCLVDSGIDQSKIVLSEESERFEELNYQWTVLANGVNTPITPLGFVLVQSVEDVQASILCAKSLNIRIIPKGGGHSYEKFSFGDQETFVIDLQALNGISNVDYTQRTFDVGAGTLLGQIIGRIYDTHGLVIPVGTCPTVGIAGLALGGGYGFLSRWLGLTTDNVLAIEIVDAAGEIRHVDAVNEPELFWALRGAGSGSFGIVTKFKFQGHTPPSSITYATNIYELPDFPAVFLEWQRLLESEPAKEINTKLALNNGLVIFEVWEILTEARNQEDGRIKDILAQFEAVAHPLSSSTVELTYPEFLLKTSHAESFGITDPSEFESLTRTSFKRRAFKANSFFINQFYEDYDIIWRFYILLTEIPMKHNITIEFYAMGGAINNVEAVEGTSFIHRVQSKYLVQGIYNGIPEVEASDYLYALEWLKYFYDTTNNLIMKHTESYQNYADLDLRDYLQRYYGSNLDRLRRVKHDVDPENLFRFAQSIPPLA